MADKVRQFTIYRIKNLDRAEQEYYQTLQRTLDKIEDDVVRLAGKELPTQAGKLTELQAAIAIRPKIRTVLQTRLLKWHKQKMVMSYFQMHIMPTGKN